MKNIFFIFSSLIFLFTYNVKCQEWQQVDAQFDPPGQYHLHNGVFIDKNNGWLTTSNPARIFHTADGGRTFAAQFDTSFFSFFSMDFIDKKNGWVVGGDMHSLQDPFMLRTSDGGITWETQDLDTTFFLIEFFDALNGLAATWSEIYYTEDGGYTWQKSLFPDTVFFSPMKFFFHNNKLGWAVGDRADETDSGMILKTYDGGRTWHTSLYEAVPLYGISFTDSLHGCAVGWGGYYTEDGGKAWEWNDTGGGDDVAFSDDTTAWSVSYGIIKKTIDRGRNWTKMEGVPNYNFRQIIFVDSGKVGYVLGSSSTLLKYEAGPVKVVEAAGFNKPDFRLYQNYPNPFNNATMINYQLPIAGKVELSIYNSIGQRMTTLVSETQPSGTYKVGWDATGLASGLYYCRLQAGKDIVRTKKLVLLR